MKYIKFFFTRHQRVTLVILSMIAIVWLLTNPTFRQLLTLRREVSGLKNKLNRTYQTNFQLKNRLYEVENNPSVIEEIARKQLQMTKPGEIIYLFGKK